MAICNACRSEMTTSPGCDRGNPILRIRENGRWIEVEREVWQGDGGYRCPDCATTTGHLHHTSCDQEYCPNCDNQLLMCACELALISIRLVQTEPDGSKVYAWGSGRDDDEAYADAERKLDALV